MKKIHSLVLVSVLLIAAVFSFASATSTDDIQAGYDYYIKYKNLIDSLESGNVQKAETYFQIIVKEIKNAGVNSDGYVKVGPGVFVKVPEAPFLAVSKSRNGRYINYLNIDDLEIKAGISKAGESRIYITFKGSYTGSDMNANFYWQLFDDEGYKIDQDSIYFGQADLNNKFKDKWVSFAMPDEGYYSVEVLAP